MPLYGAFDGGYEPSYRERRIMRALPVVLVGLGMCALVAVVHLSNASAIMRPSAVSLLSADAYSTTSASAVGFGSLGAVSESKSNILGDLATSPTAAYEKPSPSKKPSVAAEAKEIKALEAQNAELAKKLNAKHTVKPWKRSASAGMGSFAAGIEKMAAADAKRNEKQEAKKIEPAEAKKIEEKAEALEEQSKKLRAEEARVTAEAKEEKEAYKAVMAQAAAAKGNADTALHTPAKAAEKNDGLLGVLSRAGSIDGNVAKAVAAEVMSALEPALQKEQKEITKLAHDKTKITIRLPKQQLAAALPPVAARAVRPAQEHFIPLKVETPLKVQLAPVHDIQQRKLPEGDAFQSELSRFMDKAGAFTHPGKPVKTLEKSQIVHGNQKSWADYQQQIDNQNKDGGMGAYGYGKTAEYMYPRAKGSPCNGAGACNHFVEGARFNLQDYEHYRKNFLKRYKKKCEDGNGNLLNGQDPCPADDEDAIKDSGETVKIGDEQVMRELDDYVPPADAWIHNQLTSGNYGYDHFGHLKPMSRANYDMMYGEDSQRNVRKDLELHKLHSPGRGGMDHLDRAEAAMRVRIGDQQVGDDDEEVPIAMTHPKFPGPDPDHFDHWFWNSGLNQELLNGRYWKRMRKDGLMDRVVPAGDAYKHQTAGGSDRHPIADLMFGSWNQGFGYSSAKKPAPFERARIETHGPKYKDRVFTGTHEDIEMKKGVTRNMINPNAYFKPSSSSDRPVLAAAQVPVSTLSS